MYSPCFFSALLTPLCGVFSVHLKRDGYFMTDLSNKSFSVKSFFIEQCPQLHGKHLHTHVGQLQASLFPVLCTHSSMSPTPWNAVLAPSVPQLACVLLLPDCQLLLSDLCMGFVNAPTKGQEYRSSQNCRGPCKTTNAAFCAKKTLKGHQIAKEPHRESS